MKFTEASLEAAIIQLLAEQGYRHVDGVSLTCGDRLCCSLLILKCNLVLGE